MDDPRIIEIDAVADRERAFDLLMRAADYVRMEAGREPDLEYLDGILSGGPPHIGPENYFNFGFERSDGTLAGLICSLRGHYEPADWYVGLLVLDPAERGKGLGTRAIEHLRSVALSYGAPLMRVAVLEANTKGRAFWAAQGFTLEKTVPSPADGDGHTRLVLQLMLEGDTDAP